MAHTLITHHFLPTLPPTRSDEFLVISLALQTIGFFKNSTHSMCVDMHMLWYAWRSEDAMWS